MGAEWTYLIATRKVGGEDSVFSYVRLKYGSNATDTVSGMIIYPDDFSFSEAGVASMAFGTRAPAKLINAADWEALEEAGCVFLPTCPNAGFSTTGDLSFSETYAGTYTAYWASTAGSAQNSCLLYWNMTAGRGGGEGGVQNNMSRFQRIFVRLAQDL